MMKTRFSLMHLQFDIIDLGEEYYSLSEFERFDYEKIYACVFQINYDKDCVKSYCNARGQRISFENFFNACKTETQECILFNLDFFTPKEN